jgi:hypothetical protein
MWEPRRLTTLWASTACYRDSFTFSFLLYVCLVARWTVLRKWHSTHCYLQELLSIFAEIQRETPVHEMKSTVWKGVRSLFIGVLIIFYQKIPLSCIGSGITIIVCRGYSTGKNWQGRYRRARTFRYCQWNDTALPHNSAWIQCVHLTICEIVAVCGAPNFPGPHKILWVFLLKYWRACAEICIYTAISGAASVVRGYC